MQQIFQDEGLSLDAPIGDDSETPFMHFFSAKERPVDEQLAESQLMELFTQKLEEFSKRLEDKERSILQKRLLSEKPETLQEISDAFGISRERVRQIESRLIKKLREYLSQFDEFAGFEIEQKK